jgi:type II secretory pathway pseudopilin PulG
MSLGNGYVPIRPCGQRALTLAEAVVSMVIISVMLVAALNSVGASRTTQQKIADRSRGFLLAEDLMSEILRQDYEDADLAPGSFGLGGDEVGDGSRSLWDDVDDYDGWSASPPQQKDGTVIPDLAGWGRSVTVARAEPGDFEAIAPATDTGVKQIRVDVTYEGAVVVSLVAVRTNALQFVAEFE